MGSDGSPPATSSAQPIQVGLDPLAAAGRAAWHSMQGFEAMLWLRKGFGFAGAWTTCEQNWLLGICYGLQMVSKILSWADLVYPAKLLGDKA
jgi:hypothetical protein